MRMRRFYGYAVSLADGFQVKSCAFPNEIHTVFTDALPAKKQFAYQKGKAKSKLLVPFAAIGL